MWTFLYGLSHLSHTKQQSWHCSALLYNTHCLQCYSSKTFPVAFCIAVALYHNQGSRSTMLLRIPSVMLVMNYNVLWSQKACLQCTSSTLLVQNSFPVFQLQHFQTGITVQKIKAKAAQPPLIGHRKYLVLLWGLRF